MPVKKTTVKKTPAKKKPTVQKVEEATTKTETNVIRTVFRIDYPDTAAIVTYYSNLPIDNFLNAYAEGRLKDEVLTISVGLTKVGDVAYYHDDVDHFATLLIPAKYIQAIWQFEDKNDEG